MIKNKSKSLNNSQNNNNNNNNSSSYGLINPLIITVFSFTILSLVGLFYLIESNFELDQITTLTSTNSITNKITNNNNNNNNNNNIQQISINNIRDFHLPDIIEPKEYISPHPRNPPLLVDPTPNNPKGLDLLKVGTTGSYIDPNTKRQHISAFTSDYHSSRYEHINCPDFPEPGYPKTYPMKQVLDNWNPDDTTIPPFHYNSLCYFDYQTELQKALNYRNAEVPFIVYNSPQVNEVVKNWNSLEYLNKKIGPTQKYATATSKDNHFMYYNKPDKKGIYKDQQGNPWKPPTTDIRMTFDEWLHAAVENHNKSLDERKHYYFKISTENVNHWVFKELTFFQPIKSLFMVNPTGQRGIHCRFGMNSVISENHFDGSRNFAATIGGMRRWILNHPNQCNNLYMFPNGHPSQRHSEIDWSKPNYDKFERFATAETNELIVRPGDVLYLPTNWYHYIISLNVNIQCNSRSGRTSQYDKMVEEDCGL